MIRDDSIDLLLNEGADIVEYSFIGLTHVLLNLYLMFICIYPLILSSKLIISIHFIFFHNSIIYSLNYYYPWPISELKYFSSAIAPLAKVV